MPAPGRGVGGGGGGGGRALPSPAGPAAGAHAQALPVPAAPLRGPNGQWTGEGRAWTSRRPARPVPRIIRMPGVEPKLSRGPRA